MSIRVLWMRCECGKAHCVAGMTRTSVCACGRKLWEQVAAKHFTPAPKETA